MLAVTIRRALRTVPLLLAAATAFAAEGVPDDPRLVEPLAVGKPVPSFIAQREDGSNYAFDGARLKQPTVLIFYRGGWCPYCNSNLSELRHAESELQQLAAEAAQWPNVERAQLDSDWARKLEAILALGRLMVWMLGTLLGLALVAITFNTIRLQILTRRVEIEVSKLIGATNPFIRRPFLYFGALQGLAGGLAAWLLVTGGVQIVNWGLAWG